LRLATSALPLRYAPFFARLANLWQLPEPHVVAELTRARDPKAWSLSFVPGFRAFELTATALTATALTATARATTTRTAPKARLLRFEPGLRFPRHRHHGHERALVLEGAYVDDQGHVVQAGDEQASPAGSAHQLSILGTEVCVTAVSEYGIAFTSPWLRLLNPFLR
jgi:putative transcriptional regulator